MTAKEL